MRCDAVSLTSPRGIDLYIPDKQIAIKTSHQTIWCMCSAFLPPSPGTSYLPIVTPTTSSIAREMWEYQSETVQKNDEETNNGEDKAK